MNRDCNSQLHVHTKLDMGHFRILASLKFDCLNISFQLHFDIFVPGKVTNRFAYQHCIITPMNIIRILLS